MDKFIEELAAQAGRDPKRTYIKPIEEGDLMRAGTVGKIIKTKGDVGKLKEGDWVTTRVTGGWSTYLNLPANEVNPVPPPPKGAKYSIYLGALGSTG